MYIAERVCEPCRIHEAAQGISLQETGVSDNSLEAPHLLLTSAQPRAQVQVMLFLHCTLEWSTKTEF